MYTALRKELESGRMMTALSIDCLKALNTRAALKAVKKRFPEQFPFGNLLTFASKTFSNDL